VENRSVKIIVNWMLGHFGHFTGFNVVGLIAIFLCLHRRIIIFPTPRGINIGSDNIRWIFVCNAILKNWIAAVQAFYGETGGMRLQKG